MQELFYKDHIIRVLTYEPKPGYWTSEMRVFWPEANSDVEQQLFVQENAYRSTKKEAQQYALDLTINWIDNKK